MQKERFNEWVYKTQFREEASAENVQGRIMRIMWWDIDPTEASQRSQSHKQCEGEYSNSVCGLPQSPSFDPTKSTMCNLRGGIPTKKEQKGDAMRQNRMFEGDGQSIGRVAVGVKNRVDRLRAIGNGQIPAVVARAWEILGEEKEGL